MWRFPFSSAVSRVVFWIIVSTVNHGAFSRVFFSERQRGSVSYIGSRRKNRNDNRSRVHWSAAGMDICLCHASSIYHEFASARARYDPVAFSVAIDCSGYDHMGRSLFRNGTCGGSPMRALRVCNKYRAIYTTSAGHIG